MAHRKDMRRPDLIIPYVAPAPDKEASDFTGTMTSTLPMAAIFTRNKLLGWTAAVFAIQNWMAETPAKRASSSSPAYMNFLLALLSVAIGYMPLFMPPPAARAGAASGTQAPGPVPI